MKIKTTPLIKELVRDAAADQHLEESVRTLARQYINADTIEWNDLKHIAGAVKDQRSGANNENGPYLHQLCTGGGLVLAPPVRQGPSKSPELQAHLDKLRLKLEQDKYDSMVSDVTADERAAKAASEGGLVTYKQQISFGIHVIVMMAAFYLFGHAAGTAITTNKTYHSVIGLGFMVFAMLLETILFVIRTTVPPKLHMMAAEKARQKRRLAAASISNNSDASAPPPPQSSSLLEDKKLN